MRRPGPAESDSSRPSVLARLQVPTFVGLVLLFSAGAAILAEITSVQGPVTADVPWPLICAALLGVQFIPVQFHTEGQTQSIDLFAVPMLLGAVFTSTGGLLAAAAIASLARGLIRRDPAIRILFNCGNQLAGVSLARFVLSITMADHSPLAPLSWLALAAAIVTYEVVTDLGVVAVVALANGAADRRYVRNLGTQLVLVMPINAAISILTVDVGWAQRWSLLVLAGSVAALAFWYRAANRLRTRFADLQSLYEFTVKLSEVSQGGELLGVALEQTRRLLHCSHTELCVEEAEEAYRYILDDTRQLRRERVELSEVRTLPTAEAGGDRLVVPMPFGEDKRAALIASTPDGDATTFDDDDLRLFEALAAHLGTVLTSSRRLDLLQQEVAAREHEAFHDALTGLANRALFTKVVATSLKRRKPRQMLGVLIMDLDGFKDVNDTLGHHTGDAILKEIGTRVGAAVGPDRLAARLGGDEFAFLIPNALDKDAVVATGEAILAAVSEPLNIGTIELRLRASMGAALAPIHGADPSSLLKRADVAMYSAKSTSRRLTIYDPKIDRYSTRRLILASELQRAVDQEELEVYYQPVTEVVTGSVAGFEALLRWNHPEYGSISPVEFIPVAEQTGLIEPITWFVLRSALTELRRWHDAGYELDMAVNISTHSLLDTEIAERVRNMLMDIGVPSTSLVLEVTESSMMVDADRAEKVVRELADLGVQIAIDDFGTGYSSLSRLKSMPVHLVKVDRSFVQNMCIDTGDETIVRSTIELARNMGHLVVAEGVEDTQTWDRLAELGCDMIQGYLISPALPGPQAREWLKGRQAPTRAAVIPLRPAIATA